MANIKAIIKKLQTAIANKGYIIRINTYQFYSKEQQRFIQGTSLVTRQWQINRNGDSVLKDTELLRTCSQVEVLKYLADTYKDLCKEAGNEGADTEAESLC